MNDKFQEQGSQEWHELRKRHIGASDAGIILGISPWKTKYQLFEEKLGITYSCETNNLQKYNDMEPAAREHFKNLMGIEVKPKVMFHPKIKYMMASLDGLSEDGKTALEIKCGEATYKLAVAGKVPEHYNAQMQHQMAVLGLKSMFYFCFDGSTGIMLEIERNDDMIELIYREEQDFWNRVQNFDPPALTNKDLVNMDSLEWKQTAFEYINMKALREKYEREEDILKQRLIDLAGSKSCKGGGVQVSRYIRKGNIDYAVIPELQGRDLEIFRKKPLESWRITCQNQ